MFLYDTVVTLLNDGSSIWYKPMLFKVTCIMNFLYFPYDGQECKMVYGSWAHDVSRIDLIGIPQYADSHEYIQNDQWALKGIISKKNYVKYSCCPKPYAEYAITVHIKRRSYAITMNIVIPSALLAALILLSFVLPPECGERVGLCMTVLLSVTVFQQTTSSMMPPSTVPYLAQFYFASIVFTSFCLMGTVASLVIYHRPETRFPNWIRTLLLHWIASCLLMSVAPANKRKKKVPTLKSPTKQKVDICDNEKQFVIDCHSICICGVQNLHPQATHKVKIDGCRKFQSDKVEHETLYERNGYGQMGKVDMYGQMGKVEIRQNSSPRSIDNTKCSVDKEEASCELTPLQENMRMVKVMDRLFLIIFSLGMALSFLVVFLRTPEDKVTQTQSTRV